jgi:hypothetical protein
MISIKNKHKQTTTVNIKRMCIALLVMVIFGCVFVQRLSWLGGWCTGLIEVWMRKFEKATGGVDIWESLPRWARPP